MAYSFSAENENAPKIKYHFRPEAEMKRKISDQFRPKRKTKTKLVGLLKMQAHLIHSMSHSMTQTTLRQSY